MTALDIFTLTLACIGALTGVASLAWAITSHVLSGSRAAVGLMGGWVGPGGLVTMPLAKFHPGTQPDERFQEPVVCVEVRNTGRLPVSVTGWFIEVGKVSLGHVVHPVNVPLPCPLGVGESQTWVAPIGEVIAAVETHRSVLGDPKTLRGMARLGNGRTVRSRESVPAGGPEFLYSSPG